MRWFQRVRKPERRRCRGAEGLDWRYTMTAYEQGERVAYRAILRETLRGLAGLGVPVKGEAALQERMDVVALLRRLCAEFGDNDWSDSLHLSDVIEKHLMSCTSPAAARRSPPWASPSRRLRMRNVQRRLEQYEAIVAALLRGHGLTPFCPSEVHDRAAEASEAAERALERAGLIRRGELTTTGQKLVERAYVSPQ